MKAPDHDITGFHNDFEAFSAEQSQEVDTLLFGRKTYEMMKFWSTPQAAEMAPEIARFMNERRKYVASHNQSFEPGWNNVTVISSDVPAAVQQLKEQPGKTIAIFGSNHLVVSLMQARLDRRVPDHGESGRVWRRQLAIQGPAKQSRPHLDRHAPVQVWSDFAHLPALIEIECAGKSRLTHKLSG